MSEFNHTGGDIYVGLDIGGTKCSVVVGDSSFLIKKKINFDTNTERGWQAILNEFKKHIGSLLDLYSGYNLKRVGISCGGPLDSIKGIIYSPPNLPGWDNVPITRIFRDEFGVETALQNDANASDPVAMEIIHISAEHLGQALSTLIDILNPECIVIGSIYARNEMLFKPIIEKVLRQEAIPASLEVCRIVPAELGDSIGDYAALCVAIYEDKF